MCSNQQLHGCSKLHCNSNAGAKPLQELFLSTDIGMAVIIFTRQKYMKLGPLFVDIWEDMATLLKVPPVEFMTLKSQARSHSIAT